MYDTPTIDLEVASGIFRFALPTTTQMNIERFCRAPFGAVCARIMQGRFQASDTESTGLITEAAFCALDFDMVIIEGLAAGRYAEIPNRSTTAINRSDIDGWFRESYLNKWTIEQKWTVAAAIIGAMFYGLPPATNLPKVDAAPAAEADETDDAPAESED